MISYIKAIPEITKMNTRQNINQRKAKFVGWVKEVSRRRWFLIGFGLLVFIILLNIIFPPPGLKPYSQVITADDGTLLTAYLTPDDKWRMRTSLDEVTPELITAIIEKEDKWFYWHFGFNPVAIVKAFYQNITSGEIISGASTITMQTVRLLEPADRTYWNKFIEVLRAVQLEIFYSKDEILEMYLSLLPYGGNIEGVKSASYLYFDRMPGKLSLSQAILLAVLPNDPNRLRLDKENKEAEIFRDFWIEKFRNMKVFPEADLNDALLEPVGHERYPVPVLAPHFCRYVSGLKREEQLHTTLNLTIQQTAELLLSNYVRRMYTKGITNGAVLIIENEGNKVRGYCGSADFYDDDAFGQVNGITSIRSPGSTLKPVLYAMGFDRGIITPKVRLLDIPTDFSGYSPVNFDNEFRGDVTVRFALMNSLNIPAVRLLSTIGLPDFIETMKKAGFDDFTNRPNEFGLSVILGGCGGRLDELTGLFTSFARDGRLYPLSYLEDEPESEVKPVQLFSPAASYLIADILSGSTRPDIPDEYLSMTRLPKIAWKTGTSYGKRDAWSIGFSPKYTIGVWMGNFDGTGSPHLVGAESAVPLLFELFNALDYNPERNWFKQPDEVYKREVCSQTGLLPSDDCASTDIDFAIKNVSHTNHCNLYQPLYVDTLETVEYCVECLPHDGWKVEKYPVYPAALTLWYNQNGRSYKKPPPHNPDCPAFRSGEGPQIISPSPDYEYLIERGSDTQILLQAASDSRIAVHYWYINDEFYKKSQPGENIFFTPDEGEVKITCLDDKGNESSVRINVAFY